MKIRVGRSFGIGSLSTVALAPSGTHALSAGGCGVFVWDLATGEMVRTLSTEGGRALAVSPDGKRVAVGERDTRVRLLDFDDGTLIGEHKAHGLGVASVVFDESGRYLASGGEIDHRAVIWDLERLEVAVRLPIEADHVQLAFSPGSALLLSGDQSGVARLWERSSGKLLATLVSERLSSGILAVGFSSDGQTACAAGDSAICGWSTTSYKENDRLAEGGQWAAAACRNGQWMVSEVVNDPPFVCLGAPQLVGSEPPAPASRACGYFNQVAFNGQRALTADREAGRILVWDLKRGVVEGELLGHLQPQGLICEADGRLTAVCGAAVMTWSGDGSNQRLTRAEPRDLFLLPHDAPFPIRVSLRAEDYSIREFSSEKLLWRSDCVWPGGFASALDPQQRILACALVELNGTVVLVDIESGKELRRLGAPGHLRPPSALAFSSDGALLASTSGDGSTRIWRVSDGKPLHVFRDHKKAGVSVAWHPAGTHLAAGCADGRAYVWDARAGKLEGTLKEKGAVYSLAWSPEGDWLATADGLSVTLWNGLSRERLARSPAAATRLRFDSGGKLFSCDPTSGAVVSWNIV